MSSITLPVRADDPDISYEAAEKAAFGASKIRPIVLALVREHGPLTHDEFIGQYNRLVIMETDTARASDSGVRTRLHELVRAGLIIQDPEKGKSKFGNNAKRWIAVDGSGGGDNTDEQ
ncbi:hypothetical protein [Arthrobacter castelli]|uniref:hypothetical protein n=1 Tax=Arthrobacter castelli TaxID=271431 RepID=UPI00040F42FD|nr:hypothetical protein [Arthrobacter castelli]